MPNATVERTETKQRIGGTIYIDYELPRIMTLDELNKAVIYLVQIQRYATNNGFNNLEFRKQ